MTRDEQEAATTVSRQGINVRLTFVQMLFALTVTEIAKRVGLLVASGETPLKAPYAYFHLLLALSLVATSWVGWNRSNVSDDLPPVEKVFSLPFLVLLVDVALVICYYIIVSGVEMTQAGRAISPSAANEAFWVMVVFAGYLLWDVLTKAIMPKPIFSKEFWHRSWITLVCCILSIVAWLGLASMSQKWSVVTADGALLSLVLLFRAGKQRLWFLVVCFFITFYVLIFLAIGGGYTVRFLVNP